MADNGELPTVMHRSDLLAAGIRDGEIKTKRGSGAWTRVHRGAYCATDSLVGLTQEERYRLRSIAVARRSPLLVLSHQSAAALHGLPLWKAPLERVHLIRPADGGGRAGPGRVVHIGRLEPNEIGRIAGTRVTSPTRTLVDIACSSSFVTTVVAADAALRRRLVTPEELAAALASTQHRRGASAARRALRFADGRCESVGESLLRVAIHQAHLPDPQLQIRIINVNGYVMAGQISATRSSGFSSSSMVRSSTASCSDSVESAHDVVLAEKIREDRLRDLGYVVVRIVWAELTDPAAIAAKITAALARGRRVVAAAGITGTWSIDPAIRIAH